MPSVRNQVGRRGRKRLPGAGEDIEFEARRRRSCSPGPIRPARPVSIERRSAPSTACIRLTECSVRENGQSNRASSASVLVKHDDAGAAERRLAGRDGFVRAVRRKRRAAWASRARGRATGRDRPGRNRAVMWRLRNVAVPARRPARARPAFRGAGVLPRNRYSQITCQSPVRCRPSKISS